jgi:hypothetical protein
MCIGSSNVALFLKLELKLCVKKAAANAHTAASGHRHRFARRSREPATFGATLRFAFSC